MAAFYSSEVTNQNAAPPVRIKVNRGGGRLRYWLGVFTNPAAGGAAAADTIAFVRLPRGTRIAGWLSFVSWSTGAASCTMNLGDAASAARHLAATAITTAGTATPNVAAAANGLSYETSVDTLDGGNPTATNDCDIRGTIAAASVQASQVIACHMVGIQD